MSANPFFAGVATTVPQVTAATTLLLGDDLLAYLVLALGGALAVGNGLALVRPPRQAKPELLIRRTAEAMISIWRKQPTGAWRCASAWSFENGPRD